MSTEQSSSSLDPQLIEQTKQQIRSLVAEIAQLAKEDVAPQEFYGQFLPRVVSALAAVGGAVWTRNEDGRLALQYQINLQETKLRDNEEGQAQHGRLLYKCVTDGEGILVPPHSGAGETDDDQPAGNPTDFLLVLAPMKTEMEVIGVLEVFQRSETGPNTQKGYLRFLMQMCELAGDFLKSHQLRHFSDRQVLWTQLEDFTHMVHTSLDPREAAYTIANEGRRLIECDRVSVAIRKGNKCVIEAVSGQDLFDKRSNTVRLLGKLATAVVATGDSVWYTGDTSDMAPQVEDAVQEYIDESHSKNVAVLPLKRPEPPEEDDPNKREEPQEPIGALIVEQIEDSRVPQSMVHRVEVVCRHSSTALANSMEHQNLFLMPVWRTLGKAKWVLRARTLPKTLAITGIIVAAFAALVVWPSDFELHSKGTLEAELRSDVFSGIDGEVIDVLVEHRDDVKQGDLLVKLRSTELKVAITEVMGRFNTTLKQIASTKSRLSEGGPSESEQTRLFGELSALSEQKKSLKAQWDLYLEKQNDLEVTSPADGKIVSWDVRNRLIRRPVQRGQVLMQVTDPEGPWQLELQMPENRMGYIEKAQNAIYVKLRKRLRTVLGEKLGEVPDEQLEAELAKVTDPQLSPKLRELLGAELLEEFRSGLGAIIQGVSQLAAEEGVDKELPALLDPLTKIQNKTSYEKSRQALETLLGETSCGSVRFALRDLLRDDLDDRLSVTFILANDPSRKLQGAVKEIELSAEVRGEEGNTVLIKVAIDKYEVPHRWLGGAVDAHVYCGRRSIGFVLFHDLIAFIQSRILFRYF